MRLDTSPPDLRKFLDSGRVTLGRYVQRAVRRHFVRHGIPLEKATVEMWVRDLIFEKLREEDPEFEIEHVFQVTQLKTRAAEREARQRHIESVK